MEKKPRNSKKRSVLKKYHGEMSEIEMMFRIIKLYLEKGFTEKETNRKV